MSQLPRRGPLVEQLFNEPSYMSTTISVKLTAARHRILLPLLRSTGEKYVSDAILTILMVMSTGDNTSLFALDERGRNMVTTLLHKAEALYRRHLNTLGEDIEVMLVEFGNNAHDVENGP